MYVDYNKCGKLVSTKSLISSCEDKWVWQLQDCLVKLTAAEFPLVYICFHPKLWLLQQYPPQTHAKILLLLDHCLLLFQRFDVVLLLSLFSRSSGSGLFIAVLCQFFKCDFLKTESLFLSMEKVFWEKTLTLKSTS